MSVNGTATPPSTGVAALDKVEVTETHPAKGTYPPMSWIPETSAEKLAATAEDTLADATTSDKTVLYLAYGSNLSAETFLGMRKIRPLSHVNAYVPSLRLTFSLPGFPYREPCFANVDYKQLPEKPKLPDPLHPPTEWDGSLVGVVYEVTPADWRNIMRTEGGGSSYKEVMVPCFPISSTIKDAEPASSAEPPKPFFARTLFAPYSKPPDNNPTKGSWWRRLFTGPHRPSPDYAQPSARYLKLLRDGAREHHLPQYYQDYLASLQPYVRTTTMQNIGQWILLLALAPTFLSLMSLSRVLADDTGRVPTWLGGAVTALFNLCWASYDFVLKPIFGEGERSLEGDDNKMAKATKSSKEDGSIAEKESLLST